MQDSQLQTAISKGKTKWLQSLLSVSLPKLFSEKTDYEEWFKTMLRQMEERGLVEPSQQKNFLTDIRNAIKVLDPNHPALDVVKFDRETWTEINNRSSDRLEQRTTKFISNPDAIVKRATTLIKSYQWSEIAAGLAVLTGRRCTEVIKTARFAYKTKYSVIFSGSLKRRNEPVECVFEIPTLAESELVIQGISNLRSYLEGEIQDLSRHQISGRYSRAVASKCDLYFSDLVPRRDDKDNLYTHLFRAVYATIAAYWFCPPNVSELEYRAAIQGHYQILDEKNPELRHSIAAGRNYFDYKISDGEGNIDGRLGIKLHLSDVEVIERFQYAHLSSPDSVSEKAIKSDYPTMNEQHESSSSISLPAFLLPRLNTIARRLELSQAETLQALFNWTEVSLSLADILQLDELNPQVLFDSVQQLSQRQPSPSPQTDKVSSEPVSGTLSVNPESGIIFDRDSINQICTSVRLLAETISRTTPLQNNEPSSESSKTLPSNAPERMTGTNLASSQERQPNEGNNQQNNSSAQKERKKTSRTQEAEETVNRAIDAIMSFNNIEDRSPSEKWYIGIGSLRKLSGNGDTVINRVIKSRQEEIDAHNSTHQLGKWHNARGKDAPSINEVISFSRDFIK
jgi:hypothetical protein